MPRGTSPEKHLAFLEGQRQKLEEEYKEESDSLDSRFSPELVKKTLDFKELTPERREEALKLFTQKKPVEAEEIKLCLEELSKKAEGGEEE